MPSGPSEGTTSPGRGPPDARPASARRSDGRGVARIAVPRSRLRYNPSASCRKGAAMTSSLRAGIAGTVTFLTLTAALAPTGQAQPRFEWPERAKNLKVLPKDTPKEKLQATMTGFTRSLGVRCPFCHVGQEGQPLTTFDFASDQKPMKQVARGMMKLVKRTNDDTRKRH